MSDLRLGAKRNGNLGWKLYDEQYRLRKVRNPSSLWSIVDVELWLLYMSNSSTLNVISQSNQYVSNNKKLQCYTFNYNGKCFKPFCSYSHSCLQCGNSHPIIYCQQKSQYVGQVQPRPIHFVRQSLQTARFSKPDFMHPNNFAFRQQHARPRAPVAAMGPRPYTNTN